ncbi:hypothetical protein [Pseudalkalibacillus berkeleyi]|uniref:YqfQ-like protein n=1 Tax=Pseudalkalibacillus berkeleyi TaxID=1069813 RepID=A0ABS9GXF2_9BACL|nr:hypothetical protein [Pseudalkalibacillus berkeleyi]MCF6136341.1 hypothetical protein [Pseudalkalibacillus berkeleyi]
MNFVGVFYYFPQVEAKVPQFEGKVPQDERKVPQVEANVPQDMRKVPQVREKALKKKLKLPALFQSNLPNFDKNKKKKSNNEKMP